ncbi:putative gustatory receptor 28b [Schistocerca cancellata]|uniref:putative gustatory receptor 28b n=1 Tax=Schistocerca cancellata TaxID=274614 RepID=UPI0021192481|nr:putative gustatory receptor 28b [Schistocerca cancellata]
MTLIRWFGQLNTYLLQFFSISTEDDLNFRIAEALQVSSVKEDLHHDTHAVSPHQILTIPEHEIHSRRQQQNTSNNNELLLTQDRCTLLRKLRKVYCLLDQSVKTVNSAYGVQNLTQISSSLICIVVETYGIAVNLHGLSNALHGDLRIINAVQLSLWFGLMVWRIVGICYSCEMVIQEARCTQRLVTKLQMLSLPASSGVQEELQLFGEQLARSPLRYSAAGFFTLDLSLLKTIVAAVTTYLVILIQFSVADTNVELF